MMVMTFDAEDCTLNRTIAMIAVPATGAKLPRSRWMLPVEVLLNSSVEKLEVEVSMLTYDIMLEL